MKKTLSLVVGVTLLFSLVACNKGDTQTVTTKSPVTESVTAETTTKKPQQTEKIPDTVQSENGKYEIAFVTDIGQLLDGSFNQGTWEGVKSFAHKNKKSYKYYQPSGGNQATDTDRYNAMKAAAQSGARVIVCAGYLQSEALRRASEEFSGVRFIFIDGDMGKETPENVVCVSYNEEQSGFLAGYAAVMEGYTRLGFTGGGGGTNPSCNRFAYGFAQGAEEAAKSLDKEVELTLSWEYGASFSPSPELQTMLSGWYAKGTEVIFCCGGPMCQSAFAAASANDGAVIGCDVDQSAQSDRVITSAMKKLSESVQQLVEKALSDAWEELSGKSLRLGVKQSAVGLPTESWRMKNFTVEDYEELLRAMKEGEISVDGAYEGLRAETFSRVRLEIV